LWTMERYEGRFAIWGPPGTGKTTFLARQVKEIAANIGDPDASPFEHGAAPVAVCSLTRTAAAEIAGRGLPIPREQIGTLHALAYRQLGHPDVAEGELQDWCEFAPEYRMSCDRSKGGSKESLADQMGCDWMPELNGDMLYQEMCRLRALETPRRLWNESIVGFTQRWESWKSKRGLIDFTDMIEFALSSVDEAPGSPSVIIADEAQDLSRMELSLLMKWGDAAGGLMLAGDPWQALYCWRGADPGVFTDERIPQDHRRVLSQSYRVPRAVHRASMTWMRRWYSDWTELAYEPRGADGIVERHPGMWHDPGSIVETAERMEAEGKTVMIAATCGFMLKPVLTELRRRGVPFSNPWRTSRGDWNPLRVSRGTSISSRIMAFLRIDSKTYGASWKAGQARLWTWGELAAWTAVQKTSEFLRRGAKKTLQIVMESTDSEDQECRPHELAQLFDAEKLSEMLAMGERGETSTLLRLFEGRLQASRSESARYPVVVAGLRGAAALAVEPRVHVGTVHSFKGAEADVVMLFPDLSPAASREWGRHGRARDGVVRTIYVGITRAKESLFVCQPSSLSAVNLNVLAS